MSKFVSFLLLVIISQHVASVEVPDIVLPGTVYSKSKVQLYAEQEGLLTYVLDTGTGFKKGNVIAKIEQDNDNQQLVILKRQLALKKQIIEEYQNIIFSYKTLVESHSVSDEMRAQKHIDYLNAAQELSIIEQNILNLEFVIDKKNIRAPYDGVVLQRNGNMNEFINEGQKVALLFNPKNMFVKVQIPYQSFDKLDLSSAYFKQKDIKVDLPLDYVLPHVDAKSGTVIASFSLYEQEILIGQGLKVLIPAKKI
ncbi:HlyD family efflux transporter periplasmic adaptor subunit [uncultured Shewanella sp.]|uniref:efflux RND transporter periplasmic adaptor subunit n=1 Tax=uncultured Shewanella sp. TaxID=173975 RepID=UPI0026380602|nr:HlyD family efflux transporter periplasmic adaptor subunit [uncultured Shewanella sp.]